MLQVRLPTNFKAARFDSDADTAMLRELAADVEAARFEVGGETIELPVKLKVHDSVFVPLAKWAMLLAGNYRCVQADSVRSIKEAVHGDLAEIARRLRLGGGPVRLAGREPGRHGAVREVRGRRAIARQPVVGRARAGQRRAAHRARRSPGAIGRRRSAGAIPTSSTQTVALVDAWLVRNRRKG